MTIIEILIITIFAGGLLCIVSSLFIRFHPRKSNNFCGYCGYQYAANSLNCSECGTSTLYTGLSRNKKLLLRAFLLTGSLFWLGCGTLIALSPSIWPFSILMVFLRNGIVPEIVTAEIKSRGVHHLLADEDKRRLESWAWSIIGGNRKKAVTNREQVLVAEFVVDSIINAQDIDSKQCEWMMQDPDDEIAVAGWILFTRISDKCKIVPHLQTIGARFDNDQFRVICSRVITTAFSHNSKCKCDIANMRFLLWLIRGRLLIVRWFHLQLIWLIWTEAALFRKRL